MYDEQQRTEGQFAVLSCGTHTRIFPVSICSVFTHTHTHTHVSVSPQAHGSCSTTLLRFHCLWCKDSSILQSYLRFIIVTFLIHIFLNYISRTTPLVFRQTNPLRLSQFSLSFFSILFYYFLSFLSVFTLFTS
jgi:hypothetical protein